MQDTADESHTTWSMMHIRHQCLGATPCATDKSAIVDRRHKVKTYCYCFFVVLVLLCGFARHGSTKGAHETVCEVNLSFLRGFMMFLHGRPSRTKHKKRCEYFFVVLWSCFMEAFREVSIGNFWRLCTRGFVVLLHFMASPGELKKRFVVS